MLAQGDQQNKSPARTTAGTRLLPLTERQIGEERARVASLAGDPFVARTSGGKHDASPTGPQRSIAPDDGAVIERSEGKVQRSDLDSHAAGATMIEVQVGRAPDPPPPAALGSHRPTPLGQSSRNLPNGG